MMTYRVIKGKNRIELQSEVEKLLSEGFELGAFAVGFDPTFTNASGVKTGQDIYYQTLTKHDYFGDEKAKKPHNVFKPGEEPQDMGSDK